MKNDILQTLIGKILPYMNPIRDYKGNIVEQYPLVKIEDVCWIKGFQLLKATFYGGVKSGESNYITLNDIIAF